MKANGMCSGRFACLAFIVAGLLLTQEAYCDGIQNVIQKQYPGYTLLHSRKGNFTGSGKPEYIVFLEKSPRPKDDTVSGTDKVAVCIIDHGTLTKKYELDGYGGANDLKRLIRIITAPEVNFGEWDGYFCMRDFNRNGIDEVLLFQLTGMSFLPFIYEFTNGKMAIVLDPPPTWSHLISRFSAVEEGTNRYIMVWGYGDEANIRDQKGKRDWYKYVWDGEKKQYRITETGIQQKQ